jgi:Thymidylate synthase
MKQYHKLLEDILKYGQETTDRTGVGTKSIFGYQSRYDLSAGFPAVTTKNLPGKRSSESLSGFLKEAQMSEDWLNLHTENLEQSLLEKHYLDC